MPIVISDLVADAEMHLPPENILTTPQLTRIATDIVANDIPEDDDIYYNEALCKLLCKAGYFNKAKYMTSTGIKREKVDGVEVEYDTKTNREVWDKWIAALPDLCVNLPGGGYNMPHAAQIKINPSPVAVDIECINDLYYSNGDL